MEPEFKGGIFDSVARFGESVGVTSAGHQLGSLRDKVLASTAAMTDKIAKEEDQLFNKTKNLLLKAAGFTAKEMAHLNPMALGDKLITQAQALFPTLAPVAASMPSKPVLHAIIQTIVNTPVIAKEPKDRFVWMDHMLAIMFNETGGTLNPHAVAWERDKLGRKVIGAYGLFQHRKTNWNDHCQKFATDPAGRWLINATIIDQLAKYWSASKAAIIAPWGDRTPSSMEVYQYAPAIRQIVRLRDTLQANFFWNGKQWVPHDPKIEKTIRWKQLNYAYGGQLKDYLFGRQVLLTVMHTNGTAFWTVNKPLEYIGRPKRDLMAFYLMVTDARLRASTMTLIRRKIWTVPANITTGEIVEGVDDPTVPSDLGIKATPTTLTSAAAGTVVVTSGFGTRKDPTGDKHEHHYGVDLVWKDRRIPIKGTSVRAPLPGIVTSSAWNVDGGNQLFIDHGNIDGANWMTGYAHLDEPGIPKGSAVLAGDKVGIVGNTGKHTTKAHLHFVLMKNGRRVDPAKYMSKLGLKYEDVLAA